MNEPLTPPHRDPLELEPEEMRRLGREVVDRLVDRIAGLDEDRAWRGASRQQMEKRLREPAPAEGTGLDPVLDRLAEDVLPFASRIDHPRFFGYVPGCPTWPSVLADFIARGYNIFQGTWQASAGPSEIELVVLDWFKEWLGYPPEAAGLLTSGGSAANLTALACARETRLGEDFGAAVVYVSEEAHSSVERAARVLGFRADQLRTVPVDDGLRMRPDALRSLAREDVAAGRRPFLVVANAGATSTGAIDPLAELADVCAERELWLHADAAYGGFAVLTERGRAWLEGIGRADSITLDPHKWLYQPFEAGCLLVREGGRLEEAFHILPAYLQDTALETGGVEAQRPVNFADRGIQLTRAARALKIWLSVQCFGTDAFRQAIDRSLDLAERAQARIEDSPTLELLSPARLGVVCFRRRPKSVADEDVLDGLNEQLVDRLLESGRGLISSTRVDGRYALRLCILNHRSRWRDVEEVIGFSERAEVDAP